MTICSMIKATSYPSLDVRDDGMCELQSKAGQWCDRYGCLFPEDGTQGECYFNWGAERCQGRKLFGRRERGYC